MASRDILATTMRSTGLVVMAGAGLLVVGYAFYTLLDAAPRRELGEAARGERAPLEAADSDSDADADAQVRPRRPKRRPDPRVGGVAPAVVTDAAQARPTPGPPPRPEPEISLEDARKGFTDFMAELDALERRGTELSTPEWTDHYRRGHEALLPLQQHLSWSVPEQADELRRANEDLRTTLRALEPGARAESPP